MPKNNIEAQLNKRLVGASPVMASLKKLLARVAPTDLTVLVRGEPGVGHSFFARLIHEFSPRRQGPFVVVNLAAVPASIAPSELFGHERGAFTGASQSKHGLIRAADSGTLLLEDVEQGGRDIQSLLLRFLDTRTIRPVGSMKEVHVDTRLIVSATPGISQSKDISPDLLARLSGVIIDIPPLRDHREDIAPLARDFAQRHKKTVGKEALSALREYAFPGNVRELGSIIARAAALAEKEAIERDDLMLPEQEKLTVSVPDSIKAELQTARQELELLRRNAIPATPIWEGRWFPTEPDYCFVLMPFAELVSIRKPYSLEFVG
jgi:DNA-binding NtrC family response regulator